jgi:P27 family predicted phage terminase small subunit
MTRGRKKKPTYVKQAQGTLQKCRTLANEMVPDVVGELPDVPDVLKGNAVALKHWKVYTQTLYNAGVLFECDLSGIVTLCKLWADYFEFIKILDKEGYVDADGKRRAEDIIARDKLNQAMKLCVEFGFTPSARTKIPMQKKKEKDDIFD